MLLFQLDVLRARPLHVHETAHALEEAAFVHRVFLNRIILEALEIFHLGHHGLINDGAEQIEIPLVKNLLVVYLLRMGHYLAVFFG